MPRARIVGFLETEQHPFPEDPRVRMTAIARSINMEPKLTMMALCLKDIRYMEEHHTTKDMRKDFLDIMGRSSWDPQESVFANYVHGSLLPSGMVSEHSVKCEGYPEPVTVWRPTAAMERYGRPIAAFILKYSVDSGRSINSLLGTSSAPENRLRMLELLRNGASTETELIDDIGLGNNNIMNHMKVLGKERLIGFETGNNEGGNGWAKYKWKEGKKLEDVDPVGKTVTLTMNIARILMGNEGYMSVREINKASGHRHRSDVSTVLRGLYRQEVIESGKWDTHIRSDIWLEDGGQAFLEEWFDKVIDAFSDGPELAHMQAILRQFEEDPVMRADYVGRGIDMYRKISLASKRKPVEVRRREITDYVRMYHEEHGQGPRHIEIRDEIGVGVSSYLRGMERDGTLEKTKNGKAVRYHII